MIARAHQDRLGRYELLELLGQGAYCAVYRARDPHTGEEVALKRLLRTGPSSLTRFKREFRAVQGIHHPNLVELRELFADDGRPVIAMELIDGVELTQYVRTSDNDPGFDASHLCAAFSSLTRALMALHSVGVVHRDVKPRNVLVTPAGRTVLLDFGLVQTEDQELESAAVGGVGSAEYMAPEQATDATPGPAADFYALGVCLYEALTGRTPAFDARSPLELIALKREWVPTPPSRLVQGVPPALDALCVRLLSADPALRPTAAEILGVLGQSSQGEFGEATGAPPSDGEAFAGRADQLALLSARFEQARRDTLQFVLVEGESGIGKSALVAEFLRGLNVHERKVLLLRGRCYENELLAYKAFDAILEQLAAWLSRRPAPELDALLPDGTSALARLFPAFAPLSAGREAQQAVVPADPSARRAAGYRALAQLIQNVSRQTFLVFAIDDLQWADSESLSLLRALVEARPRTLLLATVRPTRELGVEVAEFVAGMRADACVSVLPLSGLSASEMRALIQRLPGQQRDPSALETLMAETQGHPLFLAELLRFAEESSGAAEGPGSLDRALWARVRSLSERQKRLLEAVALAARPYPTRVFAMALRRAESELGPWVAELLALKLLRRRAGHELSTFHDRLRSVVVDGLDAASRASLHAALAEALASFPGADAAEIARHLDAAGKARDAVPAYAQAGAAALSSLAFEQAELLYARALELARAEGLEVARQQPLCIGRGHALARAGRSAEAAEQYTAAAAHAQGEDQLRLRTWAAQHLLQAGQVEQGLCAAQQLLDQLGVRLPETTAGTLAQMWWHQASLSLRAPRLRAPSRRDPKGEDAMRLSAVWKLSLPVSLVHPLRGALLSLRYLRTALALGEPGHAARALAQSAVNLTVRNPTEAESTALFAQASALAKESEDPALQVALHYLQGAAATFRWDLAAARKHLEAAEHIGTTQCADEPWLLVNVRMTLSTSYVYLGLHSLLAERSETWVREARDRNDRFAFAAHEGLGYGFYRPLMADEPEEVKRRMATILSEWPSEPFSYLHLGVYYAMAAAGLYRGGTEAAEWLARERARFEAAALLRTGFGQASMCARRTLAAIAASVVCHAGDTAWRKSALRDGAQLARSNLPVARWWNRLIAPQVALLEQKPERALALITEGRASAQATHEVLVDHYLSYLQGTLEAGEAGRAQRQAALQYLANQGWKNPERALAMWLPALALLG